MINYFYDNQNFEHNKLFKRRKLLITNKINFAKLTECFGYTQSKKKES